LENLKRILEGLEETLEVLGKILVLLDIEKCIKQFVLNVRKNVKYRSNLQKASQFIAKIVLEKEEDSK